MVIDHYENNNGETFYGVSKNVIAFRKMYDNELFFKKIKLKF